LVQASDASIKRGIGQNSFGIRIPLDVEGKKSLGKDHVKGIGKKASGKSRGRVHGEFQFSYVQGRKKEGNGFQKKGGRARMRAVGRRGSEYMKHGGGGKLPRKRVGTLKGPEGNKRKGADYAEWSEGGLSWAKPQTAEVTYGEDVQSLYRTRGLSEEMRYPGKTVKGFSKKDTQRIPGRCKVECGGGGAKV